MKLGDLAIRREEIEVYPIVFRHDDCDVSYFLFFLTRPGIKIPLATVVIPLQRLEITQSVTPTLGNRVDVINLPSIIRLRVTMFGIFHGFSTDIVAPSACIIGWN